MKMLYIIIVHARVCSALSAVRKACHSRMYENVV